MQDLIGETATEPEGTHSANSYTSQATLHASGLHEDFLRHLEGGSPGVSTVGGDHLSSPLTEKTADRGSPRSPAAVSSRPGSVAPPSSGKSSPSPYRQQRQQLQFKGLHQQQQERVVARRQQQQQVAEAHTEWRWGERMHRVNLQQQQRRLEMHIRPSSRLPPSIEGRKQKSFGGSFCPHRLASLYNLSIRYWDEGCASLATRTLQGALKMLQQHGVPGGCAEHTWGTMELLGGSKQLPLLGHAAAPHGCNSSRKRRLDIKERYFRSRLLFSRRMFVAAERELEEVRGHLGSLLCRASLMGYADGGEGERRCSRIKEALARVEDDLLLLQEMQCMYSSPQSTEWGDNPQHRQLQRLVPLKLMPCLGKRIHLQQYHQQESPQRESLDGFPPVESECEAWARGLHQVLLSQLKAWDYSVDI